MTSEEWEKRKDYLTAFNENLKGRDAKDVQSTSAIVGEVEKSEIVDEDKTALMQDISDTLMCISANLQRRLWLNQHDIVNGFRKKKMPLQDPYF